MCLGGVDRENGCLGQRVLGLWLVGWLVDLVIWLIDWLAGWLISLFASRETNNTRSSRSCPRKLGVWWVGGVTMSAIRYVAGAFMLLFYFLNSFILFFQVVVDESVVRVK